MATASIRCKCLSMIVLFFAIAADVVAADVTGVWMAEFDTQSGVQKHTYTLTQYGINTGIHVICELRAGVFEESLRHGSRVYSLKEL